MNSKIEPIYVTFQQAKLLKEIGFDVPCHNRITSIIDSNGKYKTPYNFNKYNNAISLPEQHQVTEWFRINYNIDIQIICNYENGIRRYRVGIIYLKLNKIEAIFLKADQTLNEFFEYDKPQDAYSAAFDYILKELI